MNDFCFLKRGSGRKKASGHTCTQPYPWVPPCGEAEGGGGSGWWLARSDFEGKKWKAAKYQIEIRKKKSCKFQFQRSKKCNGKKKCYRGSIGLNISFSYISKNFPPCSRSRSKWQKCTEVMFYSICRLKSNSVYCRSRGTSNQTGTSNYFVHGSRETRIIFRTMKAKDPEICKGS